MCFKATTDIGSSGVEKKEATENGTNERRLVFFVGRPCGCCDHRPGQKKKKILRVSMVAFAVTNQYGPVRVRDDAELLGLRKEEGQPLAHVDPRVKLALWPEPSIVCIGRRVVQCTLDIRCCVVLPEVLVYAHTLFFFRRNDSIPNLLPYTRGGWG